MGESLFLQPVARWFQKLRSKKAPKPTEPGADDPIREVRDIFNIAPTPPDAGVQPSQQVVPEPEPAGPEAIAEPAPEPKLDPVLAQDVFGGGAAAGREAPAERSDATQAETPEGQADPAYPAAGREEASMQYESGNPAGPEPTLEEEMAQEATVPVAEALPEEDPDGEVPTARPLETASPGGREAPQLARSAAGEVEDALPVSVKDIFKKKTTSNPQLKALLQRHGMVDAQELLEEARQLAREIKARSR